jgi:hypothetical protein
MTVEELIGYLSKYPKQMKVIIPNCESPVNDDILVVTTRFSDPYNDTGDKVVSLEVIDWGKYK